MKVRGKEGTLRRIDVSDATAQIEFSDSDVPHFTKRWVVMAAVDVASSDTVQTQNDGRKTTLTDEQKTDLPAPEVLLSMMGAVCVCKDTLSASTLPAAEQLVALLEQREALAVLASCSLCQLGKLLEDVQWQDCACRRIAQVFDESNGAQVDTWLLRSLCKAANQHKPIGAHRTPLWCQLCPPCVAS